MNSLPFRPLWLVAPAFALGALLTACSSQPAATDPNKTAEVVSDNKTVDVTAPTADSTKTDSSSTATQPK